MAEGGDDQTSVVLWANPTAHREIVTGNQVLSAIGWFKQKIEEHMHQEPNFVGNEDDNRMLKMTIALAVEGTNWFEVYEQEEPFNKMVDALLAELRRVNNITCNKFCHVQLFPICLMTEIHGIRDDIVRDGQCRSCLAFVPCHLGDKFSFNTFNSTSTYCVFKSYLEFCLSVRMKDVCVGSMYLVGHGSGIMHYLPGMGIKSNGFNRRLAEICEILEKFPNYYINVLRARSASGGSELVDINSQSESVLCTAVNGWEQKQSFYRYIIYLELAIKYACQIGFFVVAICKNEIEINVSNFAPNEVVKSIAKIRGIALVFPNIHFDRVIVKLSMRGNALYRFRIDQCCADMANLSIEKWNQMRIDEVYIQKVLFSIYYIGFDFVEALYHSGDEVHPLLPINFGLDQSCLQKYRIKYISIHFDEFNQFLSWNSIFRLIDWIMARCKTGACHSPLVLCVVWAGCHGFNGSKSSRDDVIQVSLSDQNSNSKTNGFISKYLGKDYYLLMELIRHVRDSLKKERLSEMIGLVRKRAKTALPEVSNTHTGNTDIVQGVNNT